MDEALSEARRLGHVFTLVQVLFFAIMFDGVTRSPMVHMEEFLALSTEHGFPYYSGWALVLHGRSLIAIGQAQEGLALLTQGPAELRAAGAVTGMPAVFTWLAEAHAMLGQHAEALNCLAEAARIVEATDERVSEAGLHRVRGDLLNAKGNIQHC